MLGVLLCVYYFHVRHISADTHVDANRKATFTYAAIFCVISLFLVTSAQCMCCREQSNHQNKARDRGTGLPSSDISKGIHPDISQQTIITQAPSENVVFISDNRTPDTHGETIKYQPVQEAEDSSLIITMAQSGDSGNDEYIDMMELSTQLLMTPPPAYTDVMVSPYDDQLRQHDVICDETAADINELPSYSEVKNLIENDSHL